MIKIIDYGRGNLNNVLKAFLKFGYTAKIIDDPSEIDDTVGLVLPGVGAFGDSMQLLNDQGFSPKIIEHINKNKPFLGICLGTHLLFEESEEFGTHKGLGVLKGNVSRFKINEKVPHMGWNKLNIKKESKLLKGIDNGSYFYFVHSYFVNPTDPSIILSATDYEISFTSSIEYNNIYATQFHPEKSQDLGLKIIQNFGEICVSNSSS